MPITITIRPDLVGAERQDHDEPDGTEPPSDAPRLTFDGPRVVIGRGSSCDVRLPDPSVSQRHASIQTSGAEYTIKDEGTTNGTWVGGVKLAPRSPRALRSGDRVRVGRVWLQVKIDQTPATTDLPAATRDLALALVAQAMRSIGDDTLAKIRVVEGRDMGSVLVLAEEGRPYRIGRGDNCDLPLADEDASREHVQIVRRQSTVLARDMGSKNGTMLGDSPVPFGRDMVWRPTLMMRVGAHVMALDEPVGVALGQLELAPDEPMTVDEPLVAQAPAAPPKGAAPIAAVDRTSTTVGARKKKRPILSSTDIAVILAAVVLIGLSLAGLAWVFR